jgi:hypothetical protein
MRIHHLSCSTMCPWGSRLMYGPLGDPLLRRLVCNRLLIETPRAGLVLVDTGFGRATSIAPGSASAASSCSPTASSSTTSRRRCARSRSWATARSSAAHRCDPSRLRSAAASTTSRTRRCTCSTASGWRPIPGAGASSPRNRYSPAAMGSRRRLAAPSRRWRALDGLRLRARVGRHTARDSHGAAPRTYLGHWRGGAAAGQLAAACGRRLLHSRRARPRAAHRPAGTAALP